MPAPLPKSKFSALIEELNKLAEERASLPSLSLHRFKKEARSILKSNPAAGYLLLGILAGFEGNAEAMHRFHELAIELSGEDPQYRRNYTASLLNFRFLSEALTFARKVYENSNDPGAKLDALDTMIKAHDLLGEEDEFFKLCDEYQTLSGHVHHILRIGINADSMDEIAEVLSRSAPPDVGPQDFVEIGEELLSKVDRLIEDVRD